jgi:hypothetical protein
VLHRAPDATPAIQEKKMMSRNDMPNGSTPNGKSRGMSPFEQTHSTGYNPYDPRNFDACSFGFGGANGSAGGFGAGVEVL